MILSFTTPSQCDQCGGSGKQIDQKLTAKNVIVARGLLRKKDVANKMKISQQYLNDLERGHRAWNSDLADRFENAIKELRK